MKSIIGKVLLILTFVFAFQTSQASHLMGGEITWECSTGGQYIFTLTLYRDCNGITLGTFGETIQNPAGGNITCAYVGKYDVSPDCWDAGSEITCVAAENSPTTIPGAVEKYVYRSAPVPLNGVPPAGGWEFSWSTCCRPTGVLQNTSTGGYYLRAKMFPYIPPGATTAQNVSTCFDSSPIFAEGGSPVICTGYNFVYNHLAADKDLDSIFFEWASPLASAGTPIAWNNGYSNNAPFPDITEDVTNGPITLDGVSGEVTMLVNGFGTSAGAGSFASCIKIEAWRDCQKIAEVYRDVAISMRDDCAANNQPIAVADTAFYPTLNRNGNIYRTSIYPTDLLKFELRAQDFDFLPNGTPQSITFEAGGLQVSSPLTSGTGCLGSGSCAKFTPIAPQTGFVQGLQNNVEFEWTPDCGHLGTLGNGCGGITSTYYFTLKMSDDGCPAPAVSITTLIIDVIPGDPTAPPLASLFHQPNGDIDVFWNKAEQDSALDFNYYRLYGSNGISGPYSVVDSIANIDSLQTTVPAGSGYTCFYLIKSTGACDFLSDPSDTLCCINLQMSVSPPAPNSEYAHLEWTPLHNPLLSTSTGIYEVWTQSGASPWIKVADVPQVVGAAANYKYIFDDTVSVCSDSATYQIRVLDIINNFYSGSTYQGALFSDKTNDDILVFDSVAVNANGKAIFSWTPSTSSDVIVYYLLFNDPISGWGVVDSITTLNFPYVWDGSQAGTRSEQFKIITSDSCGNFSNELSVVSHNTVLLKNSLNPCEGTNKLSWNYYNGFPGGVGGYDVLVSIDDGTGFGPNLLLNASTNVDSSFLHSNLQAGYTYCYTIQAYDTANLVTSTSNPICIQADVPKKSRILYLAQVTNNFRRGSIDLKAFVDGEADVSGYNIERSTEIRGIFEVIGNVAKPNALPYVVNFSDYSADPEIVYYYRLRANNLCGGTDTVSDAGRNLVLDVEANSNLTNSISWEAYRGWGGGVSRYDIYRSVNDNSNYSFVASNNGNDTTYQDRIDAFGEESGKFCYYIEAVEDNNPLGFVNDNGQPFSSLSNEICKNQKARIYVPTAFRPGSDVEVNRKFGPTMRFEDIAEYDFFVLNRWGSIMFRTNDPTEFWDGKINGEVAPTGVYVYYLKFSTLEDVPQEERGTFTLVN